MREEPPRSTDAPSTRSGWKPWLRLAAAAALLLLVSEALWLWQTWPVRELLQAAPGNASGSP